MKTVFLFCGLIIVTLAVNQSEAITQQQFDSTMTLIDSSNFTEAFARIQSFKKSDSTDPEIFVLSVNYYFQKSLKSVVRMDTEPFASEMLLELKDSAGEVAGYVGDTLIIDSDTLDIGTAILKRGIDLYPNRLDMHLGLAYVTNQAGLYGEMVDALIALLEQQMRDNNTWLWSFSQPYSEDANQLILESTQSYFSGLFRHNSSTSDSLAMVLSEQLALTFPKSTYGPSNLGTLYKLKGDYDKSLSFLLKAYAIDSTDGVILINLIDICVISGDSTEGERYFRLLLETGSPDQQEYARKRLSEIDK